MVSTSAVKVRHVTRLPFREQLIDWKWGASLVAPSHVGPVQFGFETSCSYDAVAIPGCSEKCESWYKHARLSCGGTNVASLCSFTPPFAARAC